jgi:deoxyadenosine/deoxycytidine kinase
MARAVKHIAVCGNIGSGKTTLTEKLAGYYGWLPLYEAVDKNPYLTDFYEDMSRWAFNLQIYFLNSRFRQITQIASSEVTTIQDRTIYEDAYVFAANLHASGHISARDYSIYLDTFHSMIDFIDPPDLLIYLKADVPKLVAQIQKRGRPYEDAISKDYLMKLNKHYEQWIGSYNEGKLIEIDMNRLDFVERTDDFASIVSKIESALNDFSGHQ